MKAFRFSLIGLAVLLVACAGTPRHAATVEEARFAADFDAMIGTALDRFPAVPAVSVAVARSDGPIYLRAFGRADVERGLPATSDTRFYIASSTKSFVGLALALLDARGEIDLDWTLAELAPDVAFDPAIQAERVTLRHMLSHTHGFSSDAIADRLAYTGEHDPATLWRLLATLRPNQDAPLGRFHYGNIGYNVATMLVERRLGRSWQEILEGEVLRPLRLSQTLTRNVADARARGLLAAPYTSLLPGAPVPLYLLKHDDTMQSAGGMFSSAKDMARWLELNLAAAHGRRTRLPAATVASTHRPLAGINERFDRFERKGYGLGWYSGDYDGAQLFHSFGGYVGARAHLSFMPARDLGVAVLTNDEGIGFILADVIAAYAYDWFGKGAAPAQQAAMAALDRIAAQVPRHLERVEVDRKRRAARTGRLSFAPPAYAGRYCSSALGTAIVSEEGGQLRMALGRLRSALEPYAEADSFRIELIPGSGRVLRFQLGNGKVSGLRIDRDHFDRCGG